MISKLMVRDEYLVLEAPDTNGVVNTFVHSSFCHVYVDIHGAFLITKLLPRSTCHKDILCTQWLYSYTILTC